VNRTCLAIAGEQAGFSLEQMIELLDHGLSVEMLPRWCPPNSYRKLAPQHLSYVCPDPGRGVFVFGRFQVNGSGVSLLSILQRQSDLCFGSSSWGH